MKFYWESFKTFFKIGAFTLGGGYAMIPIIESEVVEKRKWIGKEEFLDLIAMFFHRFMEVGWIAAMFRGIRPAVVALIAVPTFNLAKRARIGLANCWIPLISALLIWKLDVNPVMIILAAGLGGYVYGRYVKPTE